MVEEFGASAAASPTDCRHPRCAALFSVPLIVGMPCTAPPEDAHEFADWCALKSERGLFVRGPAAGPNFDAASAAFAMAESEAHSQEQVSKLQIARVARRFRGSTEITRRNGRRVETLSEIVTELFWQESIGQRYRIHIQSLRVTEETVKRT